MVLVPSLLPITYFTITAFRWLVLAERDGTPNSFDKGTSFTFDQYEMAIVDYDVPTNGIAVIVAGFNVWVDATVAMEV